MHTLRRLHQRGEHVAAVERRVLERRERERRLAGVPRLERVARRDRVVLLLGGRRGSPRRGMAVGDPAGSRNVLTPMIGSVPSCLSVS